MVCVRALRWSSSELEPPEANLSTTVVRRPLLPGTTQRGRGRPRAGLSRHAVRDVSRRHCRGTVTGESYPPCPVNPRALRPAVSR